MSADHAPIRPATAADLDEVVEVLTAAFWRDPVMTWVWADEVRAERLRGLWRFMAGRAYLPRGACVRVPGDAAALWLPSPGLLPVEFWAEALADLVTALDGDLDRLATFGAATDEHHPHEPHRYLLAIGARPERQGSGLGSALLAHSLALADEAGEPCHLEATSEPSRRLYARFGFEVAAEVVLPGGPTVWPMRRPAG